MTTVDTDTTRWSLPGPADMPTDQLQVQLEVYHETVLLRGFEGDTNWVRTVSADEIANVFTRHLGFSSGLLPENALWWNQGETGQMVALWRPPQVWPVALQQEAFKAPARLRLPMPGLVFVCSPARAPWVYAALERPTNPEQQLYRAPAFNVFMDGRTCPGSHRFPEEVGNGYPSPSSSPSSPLPETRKTGRRSTPTTFKPYGRNWMDRLTTRLRTWFPSAPWDKSPPPAKDGGATTSKAPLPVGYLVNQAERTHGNPGCWLRLRAGFGRRLRPVRERPPDGANPGRSR